MNSSKLAKRSVLALSVVFVLITFGGSKAAAAVLTVANGTSAPCTGTFTTIQAAVTAASPGDTIQVCQGTYNELVQVTKTLTILGAQAGVDARTRAVPLASESVVNAGGGNGVFQILADNVVIDGFIVQGVVNDPCVNISSLGAGIWTNPGFSGTQGGHQIRNNIIQNNGIGIELDNTGLFATRAERNLIRNNNFPVCGGGSGGITTNFGLSNAVIDSNKIEGHSTPSNGGIYNFVPGSTNITVSNNEFGGNRRAIGWEDVTGSSITANNIHNSTDPGTADIRLLGGVANLPITCNDIVDGAGRGIWMDDIFGSGPNSNININLNNIARNAVAGLQVDAGGYTPPGPGNLNAENNFWGSATGPTIASNPGGTGDKIIDPTGVVDYTPFLTTPSTCGPVLSVAEDSFHVNYFAGANGSRPDQTVRVTNTGTATAAGSTLDLCANIYVFRRDQQLAECCSCLVTPNGLRTLSVDFDLAHNALTPGAIGEGVIKVISSEVTAGPAPCPLSKAGTTYEPRPAVRAWGTHNQDVSGGLQGAAINQVTETHFLGATLSRAELSEIQTNCAFIFAQGSGAGRCSCGRGD